MKTKILFYIKDPNGGTGRFLETIRDIYDKENYNVKVVTNLAANQSFLLHEKVIGLQQQKQNRFSIVSMYRFLINCGAFVREIKQFEPQYVFSLDLYANSIAILTKIFFYKNGKYILSTHVNLHKHIFFNRSRIFSLLLLRLIRRLYRLADIHFVPSSELRQQLIHLLGLPENKIVSIPYPLNKERIQSLSDEKIVVPKYYFLSIQRLSEQKKTDLLLNAFKKFQKTHRQHCLIILGDGEKKQSVENKVRRWGLCDRILILGWKKNPYPYIRKAEAVLLITNFEGYPYSLLETKALNTRCIASNVDFGPREILDENDILLRTNSEANIVNAFIKSTALKKYQQKNHALISLHEKEYALLLRQAIL